MLVAVAASQGLAAAPSLDQTSSALPAALDSNAILGFETPAAWTPKGDTASGTFASATATRTQGAFAYALMNPSNLTFALTSAPVASTAAALAGVGDIGATFQVDVMLPTQLGNMNNQGSLQLFISSPSRKLNNVLVGTVSFKNLRLGIYRTLKFPIQDGVRKALGGASFSDLTFQFLLNSPGRVTGTYLFDNLRVHSVPLVTADKNTRPPAGYGQSIDLTAIGNTAATRAFDAGVVQVPEHFHLKFGNAGTTKVRLELGYDGTPLFTCSYTPNADGASYGQPSCDGGIQPGDLLGASWARLTILGGDLSMKIRAQLAKNPVGDLAGAGIIPAMPTFWGDVDGCIPALPPADPTANPRSITPSCASQAAQASRIVKDYFDAVNNANTDPLWIVTPPPDFARRHGDGSPNDNLIGPPPPNDPPFNQEGHMDKGGDWDAYWQLSGKLNPDSSNNHNTLHLDADLSGHAVIWGEDVTIVRLSSTIDTDNGEVTKQGIVSPTASASLHMYLFGVELPDGGTANEGTYEFNVGDSENLDLPPIDIWIFSITLGANATVGVLASGTYSPAGIDVQIKPHVSVGAHLEGDIEGIVARGGVSAVIDLIKVETPLTARATWDVFTDPETCNAVLKFRLFGEATISSLGGEVDLVATFGVCPLCDVESWKLFDWPPLLSYTRTLFEREETGLEFDLPAQLCTTTLTVKVTKPIDGASYKAQSTAQLEGIASTAKEPLGIACTGDWQWTSSNATDTFTPSSGKGCNVSVNFAKLGTTSNPGTGPRTITLNASTTFASGVTLEGSGSASVTVEALTGANPEIVLPASDVLIQADLPTTLSSIVFQGKILFGDNVVGPTCTMWYATASGQPDQAIPGGGCFPNGLSVTWTPPGLVPANWVVHMSVTDNGTGNILEATRAVTVQATPK